MELGYAVELETYDDQMNPRFAIARADEISANGEILCGVGPYSSRIFNEIELIFHNAGLPFVAPSTTAAFVTASGYPEINRVVGRNDAQGAAGAQFAKDHGFGRVAVISESSAYARFNAGHFTEEASRLGVEVSANLRTDAVSNFSSLVNRVMADNADLVYFSTLRSDQAGGFFKEARAAGYMGAFLGPDQLDNPNLLLSSGPSLRVGSGTYYTAMAAPASGYPDAADFVESYQDLYKGPPPLYSAEAYDAAGICLSAIRRAAEAKGGDLPTRAEVAQAIRSCDREVTGTQL
jgi:branched-chain amino acid transport system substrate-binding protein